ncbi:ABC transporter ATP-binding protein [Meridianimarinicoccus aquatilis]|uniref:ABC transporter ATP-binding protein n=1 Tax=Meridianimarinicoccus aquatilis TaxID=2552766 RepID=A0A4R6AVV2_9RHOB|nr:ABC transporter ATP-binding protein [Fluviibacterium aquatile]TDL87805.1 ABC transporter ATP-binding protein [Fluviibacterium aquatile]
MAETVLKLDGVQRRYNAGSRAEVAVLRGVSLTLVPGELIALVAPSGAGKSTLLHIAGLLDRPDDGTVHIAGQNVAGLSEAARTTLRRDTVGFVYQFHHLLPEFSALENVMLPQRAKGTSVAAATDRAVGLLDRVGLSARASHRPAALSGGEQQRVAFCRALANGPKLLLADEPTGNLDPDTAEQVFSALVDVARETGLAGLVATHNPALAARMDRQVRLEGGYLVPA